MKKGKVFIIIAVALFIAAAIQFYMVSSANDSIENVRAAYQIDYDFGDEIAMARDRANMMKYEAQAHVFTISGAISTVSAVGFFVAGFVLNQKK